MRKMGALVFSHKAVKKALMSFYKSKNYGFIYYLLGIKLEQKMGPHCTISIFRITF